MAVSKGAIVEAAPAVQTGETREQTSAKNQLIHVCRVARTEYLRLGKKQAPIVKAVLECLAVGVTRLEIGRIIAEELLEVEGSRDLGARYIDLARWHKGDFRDNEQAPEGMVKIGEAEYDSPIDALMAGKHSFRAVYETWRTTVRLQPQGRAEETPEPPKDVTEGAARAFERAQVRYETAPDAKGNTKEVRLRMVDNPRNPEEQATPEAWASAMLALLEGAKVARDVLGAKLYDQVHAACVKVVPRREQKAA